VARNRMHVSAAIGVCFFRISVLLVLSNLPNKVREDRALGIIVFQENALDSTSSKRTKLPPEVHLPRQVLPRVRFYKHRSLSNNKVLYCCPIHMRWKKQTPPVGIHGSFDALWLLIQGIATIKADRNKIQEPLNRRNHKMLPLPTL